MTFTEIIPHLLNRGHATLGDMEVTIVWGHLCWCKDDGEWRPYCPTKEDIKSTEWCLGENEIYRVYNASV